MSTRRPLCPLSLNCNLSLLSFVLFSVASFNEGLRFHLMIFHSDLASGGVVLINEDAGCKYVVAFVCVYNG